MADPNYIHRLVVDSVHEYTLRLLGQPLADYNAKKEELKNLLQPGVQIQEVNIDMVPAVARGEILNMINFINGLDSDEMVALAKDKIDYVFDLDWFEEHGDGNNAMNNQQGGYRRKSHHKSHRSHRKSHRKSHRSHRKTQRRSH